jgi:hypothetical protein
MSSICVIAYIEDHKNSTITIERSDGTTRVYDYCDPCHTGDKGVGGCIIELAKATGDYRVVEPKDRTVKITGMVFRYGSYKLFGHDTPRWFHWIRGYVPYVESDCVFSFEDQTFELGGSVVTEDCAIVYLAGTLKYVTNWRGQMLGKCRVVSSWPTPRSYSSRMFQIEATIYGITYTGRSAGAGMIARLRRKASQK